MHNKGYLIVDIGTGNMRVAVVSTEGKTLCVTTRDSAYMREDAFRDSTIFSPPMWMQMLREMIVDTLAKCGEIHLLAVSSTSQREGIVLVDQEGHAFLGLPNIDNRAAAFPLAPDSASEVERRTGFAPIPSFSGPKLYATLQQQPDVARRIHKVTSISDWVGFEMTGRLAWEHSQAMHTLTYDFGKRAWSAELCGLMQIPPPWLPDLMESGTVLGTLKKEYQDLLGGRDIPFVVGGADTQMALVGMQMKVGDVGIISGTTTPVEKLLDSVPHRRGGWLNPHSEAGQYMLEVNAAYTGINYQRIKNLLFSGQTYEELETEALERGLPKMMAMFSMGLNEPDGPIAKGGFLFDNPIAYDIRPCDFMHAMALDIACGIWMALERMQGITQALPNVLMGCGGGFQGMLLPKYLAELSGKTILIDAGYLQASALGCARMCERALRMQPFKRSIDREVRAKPNAELHAYYQNWRQYREALRPTNPIPM